MAIQVSDLGDIAGRFDIDNDQAERIAATVDSEAEFVSVWENTDWWMGGLGEMDSGVE